MYLYDFLCSSGHYVLPNLHNTESISQTYLVTSLNDIIYLSSITVIAIAVGVIIGLFYPINGRILIPTASIYWACTIVLANILIAYGILSQYTHVSRYLYSNNCYYVWYV